MSGSVWIAILADQRIWGMATAMRHMVMGVAFIAGFIGIVMTIPMVSHGSLGVITNGISPMVSIASFH